MAFFLHGAAYAAKNEDPVLLLHLIYEEKPIYMMVTADGPEAKEDGNDCMFLFCSERCGKELKTVLDKEISLGKVFGTFQANL